MDIIFVVCWFLNINICCFVLFIIIFFGFLDFKFHNYLHILTTIIKYYLVAVAVCFFVCLINIPFV